MSSKKKGTRKSIVAEHSFTPPQDYDAIHGPQPRVKTRLVRGVKRRVYEPRSSVEKAYRSVALSLRDQVNPSAYQSDASRAAGLPPPPVDSNYGWMPASGLARKMLDAGKYKLTATPEELTLVPSIQQLLRLQQSGGLPSGIQNNKKAILKHYLWNLYGSTKKNSYVKDTTLSVRKIRSDRVQLMILKQVNNILILASTIFQDNYEGIKNLLKVRIDPKAAVGIKLNKGRLESSSYMKSLYDYVSASQAIIQSLVEANALPLERKKAILGKIDKIAFKELNPGMQTAEDVPLDDIIDNSRFIGDFVRVISIMLTKSDTYLSFHKECMAADPPLETIPQDKWLQKPEDAKDMMNQLIQRKIKKVKRSDGSTVNRYEKFSQAEMLGYFAKKVDPENIMGVVWHCIGTLGILPDVFLSRAIAQTAMKALREALLAGYPLIIDGLKKAMREVLITHLKDNLAGASVLKYIDDPNATPTQREAVENFLKSCDNAAEKIIQKIVQHLQTLPAGTKITEKIVLEIIQDGLTHAEVGFTKEVLRGMRGLYTAGRPFMFAGRVLLHILPWLGLVADLIFLYKDFMKFSKFASTQTNFFSDASAPEFSAWPFKLEFSTKYKRGYIGPNQRDMNGEKIVGQSCKKYTDMKKKAIAADKKNVERDSGMKSAMTSPTAAEGIGREFGTFSIGANGPCPGQYMECNKKTKLCEYKPPWHGRWDFPVPTGMKWIGFYSDIDDYFTGKKQRVSGTEYDTLVLPHGISMENVIKYYDDDKSARIGCFTQSCWKERIAEVEKAISNRKISNYKLFNKHFEDRVSRGDWPPPYRFWFHPEFPKNIRKGWCKMQTDFYGEVNRRWDHLLQLVTSAGKEKKDLPDVFIQLVDKCKGKFPGFEWGTDKDQKWKKLLFISNSDGPILYVHDSAVKGATINRHEPTEHAAKALFDCVYAEFIRKLQKDYSVSMVSQKGGKRVVSKGIPEYAVKTYFWNYSSYLADYLPIELLGGDDPTLHGQSWISWSSSKAKSGKMRNLATVPFWEDIVSDSDPWYRKPWKFFMLEQAGAIVFYPRAPIMAADAIHHNTKKKSSHVAGVTSCKLYGFDPKTLIGNRETLRRQQAALAPAAKRDVAKLARVVGSTQELHTDRAEREKKRRLGVHAIRVRKTEISHTKKILKQMPVAARLNHLAQQVKEDPFGPWEPYLYKNLLVIPDAPSVNDTIVLNSEERRDKLIEEAIMGPWKVCTAANRAKEAKAKAEAKARGKPDDWHVEWGACGDPDRQLAKYIEQAGQDPVQADIWIWQQFYEGPPKWYTGPFGSSGSSVNEGINIDDVAEFLDIHKLLEAHDTVNSEAAKIFSDEDEDVEVDVVDNSEATEPGEDHLAYDHISTEDLMDPDWRAPWEK